MIKTTSRLASGLATVAVTLAGCATGGDAASVNGGLDDARVGVDPVPRVHLFENHSSALIAWKGAGVRNRVLVHLDGHSDMDWLPDGTIARIAAADAPDLHYLEHHPYAMDGETMHKFGIWNFVYPAARLGIVRTVVWVVPDGTLVDESAGWRLAWETLAQKLEHVGLDEAMGLHVKGRVVVGEVLGIPLMVCELEDLPGIDEPVLLDVDLDYFTTSSAISQHVTERPWIRPEQVVDRLRERGIRTDVATLSLSTIGGYLPPENRWIGARLAELLRKPEREPDGLGEAHDRAASAIESGRADEAIEGFRGVIEETPEDACAWYCMAHALERTGRIEEADQARMRAITLDPLLGHGSLFIGDRHWLNGSWEEALTAYRRYLDELPVGPFTAYALRREAGSLMRLRRDREAIEVLERVVNMSARHADSLLDLGVLYREGGDLEAALRMFRRAREVVPERSTYSTALGSTLLMTGEFDEGIAELQHAVRAKPTAIRARLNLANALIRTGRPGEAAGHVRVVLSVDPNEPTARRMARELTARGFGLTDP